MRFRGAECPQQGPPVVAHQGGSQQAAAQQPSSSQQSGSSSQQTTGTPQPGQQAAAPSGPSAQAPESQSSQAGAERTPGVAVHAQSLLQQQQVHRIPCALVKLDSVVENEYVNVQKRFGSGSVMSLVFLIGVVVSLSEIAVRWRSGIVV